METLRGVVGVDHTLACCSKLNMCFAIIHLLHLLYVIYLNLLKFVAFPSMIYKIRFVRNANVTSISTTKFYPPELPYCVLDWTGQLSAFGFEMCVTEA